MIRVCFALETELRPRSGGGGGGGEGGGRAMSHLYCDPIKPNAFQVRIPVIPILVGMGEYVPLYADIDVSQ